VGLLKSVFKHLISFLLLLVLRLASCYRQNLQINGIFGKLLIKRSIDILVEIADQAPRKLIADSECPLPHPSIIIQKVAFASNNAERNSKVKILTIDKLRQGVLNILRNIENLV